MTLPPDEIAELMQFLAKKTKNVKSPMNVTGLAAEFKVESGSLMILRCLKSRIQRHRQKIHKMDEFDINTKVKMMFALSASIDKGFLKKLKKQADVEVDGKWRITKYRANDGSLKLEGSHGKSSIQMSMNSDRWQKVCQKANDDESEEKCDQDSNGQNDHENKRVDLVKFLIDQTKNAAFPLRLEKLARDYKEEFESFESQLCIRLRITRFRQQIYEMNQFDKPAKVRLMFALSASIDARFLEELQKDAIVVLDEMKRIKKYKANDGSLELEGDYSLSSKIKAAKANKKTIKAINLSSDSDDGEDDSETDGSEDDEEIGKLAKSNQASASSSRRRSTRFRKSTVSTKNNNKKRTTTAENKSAMSRGTKRTRISYSSSEASEDEEKSMTLEDDPLMDSEATKNVDNFGDDFDYNPPANKHHENLEHEVTDPNSGRDIETPEVMDDDKEDAGPSSSVKIESMSLLELLNHLRSPIAQYTPNLVHKIDENIEKLESEDQQISFHLIVESLETCIHILNTPDEMNSDEDATSLPNFFYCLGIAMCNITHPSMDDLYLKIKKLACTAEKKVSLEHIRYVMGKTIDNILH